MRSLYIKIFLWFWLAMVLLVGVTLWATHQMAGLTGAEPPQMRRAAFRTLRQLRDVSAAVSQGDVRGAKRYLARRHGGDPPRVFVLDSEGRDVLGRPLPPWIDGTRADGADPRDLGGNAVISETAVSPEGKRFRLIALLGPRSPRAGRGEFQRPQGAKGAAATPPLRRSRPPPSFARYILGGPPEIQWTRLVVAVLVSGLVCYLLARYLIGPLGRLSGATQRLSEGDLTARVGESVSQRSDEFGALGRDFDAMAERLEGLVTSQQQLLRDVSHELRSPLARLQVALGLARKRIAGEASVELDRIELETERLDSLIGQILTLTRLERQLVGERSDVVDFAELVTDVVEDARYEAQATNRSVKLRAEARCRVNGRPELLHSAVENVVRNAVFYTGEGTTVEVSMSDDGAESEWVTVSVRDHGPGVPEAALKDLFEPFYRVEDGRRRDNGGFGIGLAIAERTIRSHGGSMRAENHADGGLVVTLRLPVAQAG